VKVIYAGVEVSRKIVFRPASVMRIDANICSILNAGAWAKGAHLGVQFAYEMRRRTVPYFTVCVSSYGLQWLYRRPAIDVFFMQSGGITTKVVYFLKH